MRCKGMKDKTLISKYDGKPYKRTKNCGKQATVFLRVKYAELWEYHDNGKHEDVFGFCEECARNKMDTSSWDGRSYERKVLRVRGIVSSISPATESECTDEGADKRLHDGKREFLRIMKTKGNRDLADLWEKVFQLAWDEFRVSGVMEK